MWTKIKAIGRQIAAKKTAEKATNTSDGQTLFDQLGKFKIAIGCFMIAIIALIFIAPLLVLIPSFSAIHLLQFVDPAYADQTNGSSATSSATRNAIVERAKAEVGKPYVWGAVGPNSYDCSGLVSYALTGEHKRLGNTHTFMTWKETTDPQPGDICVTSEHTGIYIGDGQMVHAAGTSTGVIIGPVQEGMKYVVYFGLQEETNNSAPSGEHLTPAIGRFNGPSGEETYYNLPMEGVVEIANRECGVKKYWVRDDGCKMYGDYIMVAANLNERPRCSFVDTSLGKGIVVDTGSFAEANPHQLDIAVTW